MRIPFITSVVLLVAFVISSLWLALVVASPFMVSRNTLEDLSGSVGVKDNGAVFKDLDTLPKAIYSIGDVECHQISDRSYYLNGNQMPFCARDLGLFIGLAAGFGVALFYRVRMNPLYFLLGLIPMGIDGGLQAFTSYESNNPLRLATGIIAGAALAVLISIFVQAFQMEREKARTPRLGV